MPKAILFSNLSADQNALLLRDAPPGFETRWLSAGAPTEEKAAAVRDADFLLLWGGDVQESVLRAATRLRLIQLFNAGYDQMDLALTAELGVPVADNGGRQRPVGGRADCCAHARRAAAPGRG